MMIPGRDDVADELVHFVKGDDDSVAFDVLRSILHEHRLLGGTGFIRGEYRCVCFTEAPLLKIGPTVAQAKRQGRRYRPFGILVSKKWLYAQGGRPVIYGPDQQFDQLPPAYQWRHVRYEPAAEPPIDFSWEREWRVRIDELEISPPVATVLARNSVWADRLLAEHDREQDRLVQDMQLLGERSLAEMYRETYPWRIELVE